MNFSSRVLELSKISKKQRGSFNLCVGTSENTVLGLVLVLKSRILVDFLLF